MEVFYYAPRKERTDRRSWLRGARRTPEPMAGQAFTDPCHLPPTLAQRLAPLLEALAEENFREPRYLLSENALAMEPEAHLLLRHASGYAAVLISLHWGEAPSLCFFSLIHRGEREELLLTPSQRLSRAALPAGSQQSPAAWPWPKSAEALWELHKRSLATVRRAVAQTLPGEHELLPLCDGLRLALHRRQIATRALRLLRDSELQTARRRMAQARDYAERMSATGARHALLFTRLHEQLAREKRQSGWPLHSVAVLLAIAAALILLGEPRTLLYWALGGAALHLTARRMVERLCRWRGVLPEDAAALTTLAGPLALGLTAAGLAWADAPPPPQALLFTLGALVLLLPLPGLDGGALAERLLYRRGAWVRPLIFLCVGAGLGVWAWSAGELFLAWVGGLIALSPLLSGDHPLLTRRLRRQIDWRHGATPEAISALISALEKRRPTSFSRLLTVYHGIHARPTRAALSILCALLYTAALLLPLYPAAQWFRQSPTLTRIAETQRSTLPTPIESALRER